MSEQDFFFDEEPEAKTPAAKGSKATASAPSKSPAVESAPVTSVADGSTTWAVAALIGVIGLLFGAILGFLLGNALSGNTATAADAAAPAPITGTQPAPQLTTEQIAAGQLPAGHPAVNASGTSDTSATK